MTFNEDKVEVIGIFLVAIVIAGFSVFGKSKVNQMNQRAEEKQEEANRLMSKIQVEVDNLESKIKFLQTNYENEAGEIKRNFEQHMLNQQELITKEVEGIKKLVRVVIIILPITPKNVLNVQSLLS